MTVGPPPRVAAVVLAWNGCADTLACLESLLAGGTRDLPTVLVDNGSTDGTADAVRRAHPDVIVLQTGRNLGFAGGSNVGIEHALEIGAEHVMLLNNDTFVADDMVDRLVDAAIDRPDAAALCPVIYFADPPDLVWYAGATFDPRKGRSGRMTGFRSRDAGPKSIRPVDRAVGAGMLMSAAALREVGLFDPDLFLHYEDAEWSLRARSAGFSIYVVPEAKMWHRVSAATGGEHSPLIAYYRARNHLEVCGRYAPLGRLGSFRRAAVATAVHLAEARKSDRPLANARSVLAGFTDYRRGRLGMRPA